MALIKGRKQSADSWKLLEHSDDASKIELPAFGDLIVPLSAWRAQRQELLAHEGGLGIWLTGSDEPGDIASDLEHFDIVAVRFASFTDGRGYSIGRLLRERYRWLGELRAIGDVQRDQLYYLFRCGFDAYDLRDGEDVETAFAAFNDFSEAYQTGVDRSVPLFRRREAAGGHG